MESIAVMNGEVVKIYVQLCKLQVGYMHTNRINAFNFSRPLIPKTADETGINKTNQ